MMQLGFVSAILPEQNLEEVFHTAAAIGYDCVEVMCWPPGKSTRRYAGITHIDVTNLNSDSISKLAELQDQYGIRISGLGYYPNPLSPDAMESTTAVEHIKSVIAATSELGLTRMNTFVGRDWTKSIDDNWPRFLETWKPIIRLAEATVARRARARAESTQYARDPTTEHSDAPGYVGERELSASRERVQLDDGVGRAVCKWPDLDRRLGQDVQSIKAAASSTRALRERPCELQCKGLLGTRNQRRLFPS